MKRILKWCVVRVCCVPWLLSSGCALGSMWSVRAVVRERRLLTVCLFLCAVRQVDAGARQVVPGATRHTAESRTKLRKNGGPRLKMMSGRSWKLAAR